MTINITELNLLQYSYGCRMLTRLTPLETYQKSRQKMSMLVKMPSEIQKQCNISLEHIQTVFSTTLEFAIFFSNHYNILKGLFIKYLQLHLHISYP